MFGLRRIRNFLNKSCKPSYNINPTIFNDDIALKTDWGVTRQLGINLQTHKLQQTSPHRIEFIPTNIAMFFSALFKFMGAFLFVIGGFMLILFIVSNQTPNKRAIVGVIVCAALGIIFFMIGKNCIRLLKMPRVIDKKAGYYWKGFDIQEAFDVKKNATEFCQIKEIHAIQLLEKAINQSTSSGGISHRYNCYEFNLVLRNSERLNILFQTGYSSTYSMAKIVSLFLDIPIWDATYMGNLETSSNQANSLHP